MDDRTLEQIKLWLAQPDRDVWLQGHPEEAEFLSRYRALDTALASAARPRVAAAEPSAVALAAGRSRLISALNGRANATGPRSFNSPVRAGAMVALAVAAFGIAGGASAAFGGGGVGSAVLGAVSAPFEQLAGINNSDDHADNGRAHANENAFEGSGNADDHAANGNAGECNAAENAGANVTPQANPNAPEQCENAPDGQANAGDNPGGKPDDPGGAAPTPPVTPPTPQGDQH